MVNLSTRERIRRSPYPWLVMIVLVGVSFFLVVYPLLQERSEKVEIITTAERKLAILGEEKEALNLELQQIRSVFEKEAGETLILEQKTLPQRVSTDKIAQVLEVFSIEIDNFDLVNNSVLRLNNISFSEPMADEELGVTYVTTNISLEASRENIPKIIQFIQGGKVPEDYMQKAESNSSIINSANYQFLKKHGIPIATIAQLQSNLQKKQNQASGAEVYDVKIRANFYSES